MHYLILDAGGSSVKTYYSNNEKTDFLKKEPISNIQQDYDKVYKTLNKIIKEAQLKYSFNKVIISLSGAISYPDLAKQLKQKLSLDFNLKIKLVSDIYFHFYKVFLKNDGILINLGTGTSILKKENEKFQLFYGFGAFFDEPGSGYNIAKKLLQFLALQEDFNPDNKLYLKFLSDFGYKSLRSKIATINSFSITQTASFAGWLLLLKDKKYEKDILEIISNSIDMIIKFLTANPKHNICFVGSIVQNKKIQNLLLKHHKHLLFKEKNIEIEKIWSML